MYVRVLACLSRHWDSSHMEKSPSEYLHYAVMVSKYKVMDSPKSMTITETWTQEYNVLHFTVYGVGQPYLCTLKYDNFN